jgi:hypothetical protein
VLTGTSGRDARGTHSNTAALDSPGQHIPTRHNRSAFLEAQVESPHLATKRLAKGWPLRAKQSTCAPLADSGRDALYRTRADDSDGKHAPVTDLECSWMRGSITTSQHGPLGIKPRQDHTVPASSAGTQPTLRTVRTTAMEV